MIIQLLSNPGATTNTATTDTTACPVSSTTSNKIITFDTSISLLCFAVLPEWMFLWTS